MTMGAQYCKCTKNHWDIYIVACINYMVCKLHFKKNAFLKSPTKVGRGKFIWNKFDSIFINVDAGQWVMRSPLYHSFYIYVCLKLFRIKSKSKRRVSESYFDLLWNLPYLYRPAGMLLAYAIHNPKYSYSFLTNNYVDPNFLICPISAIYHF